ncbi:MAG: DUF2513 domain-containing protein [Clostridiales bacterium]
MKLNPDCIRDILLAVEEVADGENELIIEEDQIPDSLSAYSFNEIFYHSKQCKSSGYFEDMRVFIVPAFSISDLSPQGHEMLRLIREETTFNKIKKALVDKGLPFALEAVKSIIIG